MPSRTTASHRRPSRLGPKRRPVAERASPGTETELVEHGARRLADRQVEAKARVGVGRARFPLPCHGAA